VCAATGQVTGERARCALRGSRRPRLVLRAVHAQVLAPQGQLQERAPVGRVGALAQETTGAAHPRHGDDPDGPGESRYSGMPGSVGGRTAPEPSSSSTTDGPPATRSSGMVGRCRQGGRRARGPASPARCFAGVATAPSRAASAGSRDPCAGLPSRRPAGGCTPRTRWRRARRRAAPT